MLPCSAEHRAVAARRQRRVEDIADPDLAFKAAVGVQRRLVRTEVEHARIIFEDRLGAVAVVHVEVDDRHPLHAVLGQRMGSRDGDAVEQAEAHGSRAGRMVARWAHRAECQPGPIGENRVNRGDACSAGPQRRLRGVRGQHRVRIQPQRRGRHRVEHHGDQFAGMHPGHLGPSGQRRLEPAQLRQGLV